MNIRNHRSRPKKPRRLSPGLLAFVVMTMPAISVFAQQPTVTPPPSGQPLVAMASQPVSNVAPAASQATLGGAVSGVASQTVVTAVETPPTVTPLDFDCGHVIQLLMTNRFRQNTFQNGSELAPGLMIGSPWQQQIGDLELLQVQRDGHPDPQTGPVVWVTLRNNSQRPMRDITATAVAVLGQIHIQSPGCTVSLSRLGAGETMQFRMQLPAAAMGMQNVGGSVQPFETLVVAIDGLDEFVESNELNNVLILRRDDVPLIVPAASAIPPMAPAAIAPPLPSSSTSEVPAIAAPQDAKPTSPLDAIDPDKLGEENAGGM